MADRFTDMPRQMLRRARKAVGLPASSNVAILAAQIGKLLTVIGSGPGGSLGFQVTDVAISIPYLYALYYDDLADACEHNSITYLPLWYLFVPLLYDTMTAYVGYGFGLCKHPEDKEKCNEEYEKMEDKKYSWPVILQGF
jgi:hypothetical protein